MSPGTTHIYVPFSTTLSPQTLSHVPDASEIDAVIKFANTDTTAEQILYP